MYPFSEDVAERSKRNSASLRDQLRFLRQWWPAVFGLVLMYSTVNAFRLFRDYFNVEIWEELPVR